MRIAHIAPLYESVPPQLYGGTERIVAYLADAQVDLGHEVSVFASGDSRTRAEVIIDRPQLPHGVDRLRLERLDLDGARVDLMFQRVGDRVLAAHAGGSDDVRVMVRM